jgi:hypothetical protein
MTEERLKMYIEDMKSTAEEADNDRESAHIEADDILCAFIRELGYTKLAEIYESFGKWYA